MRLLVALLDAGGDGPVRGTAEVLRMCAMAANDRGAEVMAALPPSGPLAESIAPHASAVALAPAASRRDFGRNVAPILKAVRQFRPDVVHFHVPSMQWGLDAVITAGVARSTRVIRTEHNPLMRPPEGLIRAALRLADRGVDEFVYVSAGNRSRFERHLPWRGRGIVVNNTIDPRRMESLGDVSQEIRGLLGPGGRDPLAAFVAGEWQLTSAEGRRPLAPILEALSLLTTDRWNLVVVGNGPVASASQFANQLGIGDRVTFLGSRPDAAAVIARSDALVSASHFEGCSVAFLEAWYLGVPVLTTDVDGVEDVVGPDDLPSVVVPHNDPQMFARAWGQLTNADSAIRRANAAATQTVRNRFTPDSFAEQMWRIYTA